MSYLSISQSPPPQAPTIYKTPPLFIYKPLLPPPLLSLPFQSLPKPSRQLRLMPPRLRIVRRTLPVCTAHPTGDRWPTGQVCAAVAAVEGVLYRRSCGGVDGEVGFWGDSVTWVGSGGGGVLVGAPGGSVTHCVGLGLGWFGGSIVGMIAVNEVVVL